MELYPATQLTSDEGPTVTVTQRHKDTSPLLANVQLAPPLNRASMVPVPWGSLNPITRWFASRKRGMLRHVNNACVDERCAGDGRKIDVEQWARNRKKAEKDARKELRTGPSEKISAELSAELQSKSHAGSTSESCEEILANRQPWPATPLLNEAQVDWQIPGNLRRTVLLLLMFSQTAAATFFMQTVLPYQGTRWLEILLLILFAILFCWVSAGFWTAMAGFLVLLRGSDRFAVTRTLDQQLALPTDARTAIVMPIRNEDPVRVFAGLRATIESLQRAGAGNGERTGEFTHFDFFILSDSNQSDIRAAELAAWARLCKAVNGFGNIFYRHRKRRVKRKSGNLDDFCRRWGRQYRYMIVLDADSVMSGNCLANLVRLMESHPTAGIIQTAPVATGGSSLYARIQQFANRVYGPLFTAGLHYWQLGESHYWGHNAIIRLAPFMQHCALASLPGRGSLAGEILSHDFVEAALMRRAGWSVWIAYDLQGSYEEMPSSLLEELNRDRRWCHGNLMNFRLFTARGVHHVHRAVFATGVMAYLSAPLWLAFLALSTAFLAQQTLTEPQYFVTPRQLFPIWPQWHPQKAIALFSATATLLFLPKILASGLACWQGAHRFGGALRLLSGILLEILFSMLLAPVRMMFHTRFVAAAFLGWSLHWKSPPRHTARTDVGQAVRRHGADMLLGLLWAGGVYLLNPGFLPWLAPIAGGLILSIPISILSSGASIGRWCSRRKLFLIPEEAALPTELLTAAKYVDVDQKLPQVGFADLVIDPALALVALYTGRPRAKRNEALLSSAMRAGPSRLNEHQKNTLLDNVSDLSQLHTVLMASPNLLAKWQRT